MNIEQLLDALAESLDALAARFPGEHQVINAQTLFIELSKKFPKVTNDFPNDLPPATDNAKE